MLRIWISFLTRSRLIRNLYHSFFYHLYRTYSSQKRGRKECPLKDTQKGELRLQQKEREAFCEKVSHLEQNKKHLVISYKTTSRTSRFYRTILHSLDEYPDHGEIERWSSKSRQQSWTLRTTSRKLWTTWRLNWMLWK